MKNSCRRRTNETLRLDVGKTWAECTENGRKISALVGAHLKQGTWLLNHIKPQSRQITQTCKLSQICITLSDLRGELFASWARGATFSHFIPGGLSGSLWIPIEMAIDLGGKFIKIFHLKRPQTKWQIRGISCMRQAKSVKSFQFI